MSLTQPRDFYKYLTTEPEYRKHPALKLYLDPNSGHIIRLQVVGEATHREPAQAMTLDHPFVQNLLAAYEFDEEFLIESAGLVCQYYNSRPAEPTPKPIDPAAEIAQCLTSEYPEHAARIQKGLELYQAGVTEFPQYQTVWDPAGFYGCFSCSCPDAQHRQPRSRYGIFCKHSVAMFIAKYVRQTQQRVTMQKLASKMESRLAATAAGYEAALKPDAINRKAPHVYQVGRHLPR